MVLGDTTRAARAVSFLTTVLDDIPVRAGEERVIGHQTSI
jgi:hypothetical protein